MSSQRNGRAGRVLYLIVCLLGIATLALYAMNATRAYYVDLNSTIVALLAAALVCTALAIVLEGREKGRAMTACFDVLKIAVPAFTIVAGVMFASARVESIAQVLGSNLELGNVEAQAAATQAVTVIAASLATWLVSVVAAFVGSGTEKRAR